MTSPDFEAISFDRAVEVQDRVLDMQWPWLKDLQVSDQLRWDIFTHLCAATGKLMDAFLDPEKLNKMMEE